MKVRDKTKPDYKKFMKRPAPLVLSPPTEGGGFRSAPTSPVIPALGAREEDFPWAEIIVEPKHRPGKGATEPPSNVSEMSSHSQDPPLALFGFAVFGLAVLFYLST